MQISTRAEGDKAFITVVGKLTVQTSSSLSAAAENLNEQVRDIVIDLSGVEYIASAGLRVLVAIDKLAMSRGGTMLLLHPTDGVMDAFQKTGFDEILAIQQ